MIRILFMNKNYNSKTINKLILIKKMKFTRKIKKKIKKIKMKL